MVQVKMRLGNEPAASGGVELFLPENFSGVPTHLFVVPHDDDVTLMAAMTMMFLRSVGHRVVVAIVTDGSNGYYYRQDRPRIVETRRKEMVRSMAALGLLDVEIVWLRFPDNNLSHYKGRRQSEGVELALEGALAYVLRRVRPTNVFVPHGNDLHIDHKVVYEELLISLFHAAGKIWRELGEPLERVPQIFAGPVYCDFAKDEPPTHMVCGTPELFEKKLAAIAAFQSQLQIAALVEQVRRDGEKGPVELFRLVDPRMYSADKWRDRFAA